MRVDPRPTQTVSGVFAWPERSGDDRFGAVFGDRRKLASRIAADVLRAMVEAGWPLNELLGSEGALAERYSVSRSVIREAVRLLEHQGIAKMRRGPDGGLAIDSPTATSVAIAIGIIFDHSGVTLDELIELQAIVEPWAARGAAERATEEAIIELRAAAESHLSLGDERFSDRRGGLHVAIAWRCGNPVISLLVGTTLALLARYSVVAARQQQDSTRGDTAVAIDTAHAAILLAIEGGDVANAGRLMERHVDAMATFLATTHGNRQEWTDVDVEREASRSDQRKLAEIVAERVKDDIVAAGWQTGSKLGTEPELIERYGVSRAVFRESVRLLEHHSVVSYRAGSDGGLMVDEPNIDAVVEAASAFLLFHGATSTDLAEARRLLEGHIAAMAARRGSPAGAARLVGHLVAPAGAASAAQCTGAFHVELARLGANRALALVIEVLMGLQRSGIFDADEPATDTPTSLAEHSAILEAVLAGDPERAADSARSHLAFERMRDA